MAVAPIRRKKSILKLEFNFNMMLRDTGGEADESG
jgi:hypothetical protein